MKSCRQNKEHAPNFQGISKVKFSEASSERQNNEEEDGNFSKFSFLLPVPAGAWHSYASLDAFVKVFLKYDVLATRVYNLINLVNLANSCSSFKTLSTLSPQ